MDGIIGRKVGMSRIFDEKGNVVPVTVLEAGPCSVVQVKTTKTDGYNAVQLGFLDSKESRLTRSELGHLRKAQVSPKRIVREIRVKETEGIATGSKVSCDIFASGEHADIIGISKGKGFSGVIKAHGFHGGATGSHGGSTYQRAPGSMGQSSYPSRVYKGKRLAKRLGGSRTTVVNIQVAQVIPERNLLLVRGAVPGPKGGIVTIVKSKRRRMAFVS
jgi:large subunit ribosomal protein L3